MNSEQLFRAPEALSLSVDELGELAGVDPTEIRRLENGDDMGESKSKVLRAALDRTFHCV